MVKCRRMKRLQFLSENWTYSWQWNSSRIRQQFYRWESFAMNMDTQMSGSTVKNHILLKIVFEYSVILKLSYQSWFLVYLQPPQARPFQHPRLLQVGKLIIQITIQQSSQVKVWTDKHGETRTLLKHQKSCYMIQPNSQNRIKMRITNRYGKPVFRHTGMVGRIQRGSCGSKSSWTQRLTRDFFSWTIIRTYEKCGFG